MDDDQRGFISFSGTTTRWAPTSYKIYKWRYNPYKSPYKLVIAVITPISGVITLLITSRAPPCMNI